MIIVLAVIRMTITIKIVSAYINALISINIMIIKIIIIDHEKCNTLKRLEVAIYAVFLIAHSVKKMFFNSVFIRNEVLCCFYGIW